MKVATIPIIKHVANECVFSFVWLDAHKQRENIWYLVIIIRVESYNDYQVFESYNDYQVFESYNDYQVPDIFSACERHARQKRKNIKQAANEYFFSFVCHASVKEFVDLSVRSIVK